LIFEHPPRKQSRCRGKGRKRGAKILCVLYYHPIGGYPKSYARDGIPKIERYPGGQSAPTPEHIDFKPGELLGSVSGELGLRAFIKPILPS
jgi:formate dehydrogenase